MIGTIDLTNKTSSEDLLIPLIDGDIIRYDKKGFFEVS
jgi:hypothetical protein